MVFFYRWNVHVWLEFWACWLEFWACSYVQFYLGRSVLVCVRVCGSPVCMSVCDLMHVDLYEAVTRYT